MKKLLKKRVLIPLAVVTVMAIAATAAYAWWTAQAHQTGNSLSTGTASLEIGGGPISLSGLQPQVAPAATDPDSTYGAVSYLYVHNTGSTPLMFFMYLADPSGNTDPAFLSQIRVRIWLLGSGSVPGYWSLPAGWADSFGPAGGPFVSFDGTLDQIWNSSVAGKQYLASISPAPYNQPTPIGANEVGVYRVAVWLDSGALDNTQGQTAGFSINAAGKTINDYNHQGWTGL